MCQSRRKPSVSGTVWQFVDHICWHVAKKPFFWPKTSVFIQGSQRTTWNPKVKIQILLHPRSNQIQNLNQCFPHIRGNSQKWGSRALQLFMFFLVLKMLPAKKRFACAPPSFFLSKETRYWLLQALGGTQGKPLTRVVWNSENSTDLFN